MEANGKPHTRHRVTGLLSAIVQEQSVCGLKILGLGLIMVDVMTGGELSLEEKSKVGVTLTDGK